MDRSNTNFPEAIYSLLKNYELDDAAKLHYYQEYIVYIFKQNLSKGIGIIHHMGSGKSILSMAIADVAINELNYKKVYFLAPSSLEANMNKAIDEYNTLMNKTLDKKFFKFLGKSHTVAKKLSAEELMADYALETKASQMTTMVNSIDKALIIIDEVHQFMQLISNGSAGLVAFYDLLMKSPNIRLILMTGTIINSRPFELVPLMNLLSGERLFPENEDLFLKYFWDDTNKKLMHRNKFQNRIFGLISRIDPRHLNYANNENKIKEYPDLYEAIVRRIPMTAHQLTIYLHYRDQEVKESSTMKSRKSGPNTGKFGKQSKKSSTYRVRTRKVSNYNPPAELQALLTKKDEDGKRVKEINELFESFEPEKFESPKLVECDLIMKQHKNQKGITFCNFINDGGGGALKFYMLTHGYQMIKFTTDIHGNKTIDLTSLGPNTFGMLNGSIPNDEYDLIFNEFNKEENDYGSKIFHLIIGEREALGLDLKAVRYGIMLGPMWIYSIYEQFIHRMKRFRSHTRLKPAEQNCQPYILLAVYPSDFSVDKLETLSKKSYEKTTDEAIYQQMLDNRDFTIPFADACFETAIECQILKERFPEMKCRTCAPNNAKLFTKNKIAPIEESLAYDIREPDPCKSIETKEISAKEIKVKNKDGEEFTYYYIPNADRKDGVQIFYFNALKNLHEEVFPYMPNYPFIIEAINKKN